MSFLSFFQRKKGGVQYIDYRPADSAPPRESLGRLEEKYTLPFDHRKHKDTKRAHIAFVFVYGYMIIVTLIILGVPFYNWWILSSPTPLDLDKTLAQAGSLLGTPLGFVVGYYFKEDKE